MSDTKQNNIAKKKKYIGRNILTFFLKEKKITLIPNQVISNDLIECEQIKSLIKEKKIIDI